MVTRRIFFVRHLPEDSPERKSKHKYVIELVDAFGRATDWCYIDDEEHCARIGEVEVPYAVMEAARCQLAGCGDFVDEDGQQMLPRDF